MRRRAAARRGVSGSVGARLAETMGAKRPEGVGAIEKEGPSEEDDVLPISRKGEREDEGAGGGGIEEKSSRWKLKGLLLSERVGRGEAREAATLLRRDPVADERALTVAAIISAAVDEGPWIADEVEVQEVTMGAGGETTRKGLAEVDDEPIISGVSGERVLKSSSSHPSPVSSLHCTSLRTFLGDDLAALVGWNETPFLGLFLEIGRAHV